MITMLPIAVNHIHYNGMCVVIIPSFAVEPGCWGMMYYDPNNGCPCCLAHVTLEVRT